MLALRGFTVYIAPVECMRKEMGPLGVDQLALDLLDLLKHLQLPRTTLLAHSFGALVALRMAAIAT